MSEDGAPGTLQRLKEVGAFASRCWRGFGHRGPRGPEDGPLVLVIPGFIANDRTTMELRRALAEAGFRVHPWREGMNWGAKGDPPERLKRAVDLCGAEKPPVPTLAIWSRRDGIVGAPSARGTEANRDKAVEVDSSHMGFAVSKKGTRQAVAEIVKFLAETEGAE